MSLNMYLVTFLKISLFANKIKENNQGKEGKILLFCISFTYNGRGYDFIFKLVFIGENALITSTSTPRINLNYLKFT